MTKPKKPYLPNNWRAYRDAPDDMFERHTFDEIMEWKVAGWEIPDSVCAVIRVMDVNTKKVREYTYQRKDAVAKRIRFLMEKGEYEFTVATADRIAYITPEDYEDDD